MDQMQTIIKREFENASLGQYNVTQVEFTKDECIIVTCEGHHPFTMEIGSDDYCFTFTNPAQRIVVFPFPPDWFDAIDENNFS
jgi:hypothetical protein